MNATDHEHWVSAAREQTRRQMEDAKQRFGLGTHARYEIDLPEATIRFLDKRGTEQVRASLQVAGSWSSASESWMWGWENTSVPEAAVSRLYAVRERGEKEALVELQAGFTGCDEGGAWTMASLASDIVGADCVYRAKGPKSELFLLLTDLRRPS